MRCGFSKESRLKSMALNQVQRQTESITGMLFRNCVVIRNVVRETGC